MIETIMYRLVTLGFLFFSTNRLFEYFSNEDWISCGIYLTMTLVWTMLGTSHLIKYYIESHESKQRNGNIDENNI
jgi:hypothetical protein